MSWTLYISHQARQDIDDIWHNGLNEFGIRVADDYELLIQQSLQDLMEDPRRTGTKPVRGHKEDILSYPIIHSKPRAKGHIKHPRHAVYYYLIGKHIVAIASISRQEREQHIGNLRREDILKEIREN